MNSETMTLAALNPPKGRRAKKRRLGRGPGSGRGKTAGRGENGQKSRAGGNVRRGFEGGQMPLQRRVPKRGFTNIFRVEYQILNVKDLEYRFPANEVVNKENLIKHNLIKKGSAKKNMLPIKLLGDGKLTKAFSIELDRVTPGARKKIEAAGGSIVELLTAKNNRAQKDAKRSASQSKKNDMSSASEKKQAAPSSPPSTDSASVESKKDENKDT